MTSSAPTRRSRTGLALAGLVIAASLTACSDSTGDTTCGEFTDMSAAERRDLIREGVAESDDAGTQEALDAASDDDLDDVADVVDQACADVDADTTLDELGS